MNLLLHGIGTPNGKSLVTVADALRGDPGAGELSVWNPTSAAERTRADARSGRTAPARPRVRTERSRCCRLPWSPS